jgi:metal-responsive CopG/Arc/MetJ family transcriptional regulator
MKTAISLPDELFEGAEDLAKRLGVSRSELYRRALAEYLARHAPDRVTEAYDALCDRVDTRLTDFGARAAGRLLGREEW